MDYKLTDEEYRVLVKWMGEVVHENAGRDFFGLRCCSCGYESPEELMNRHIQISNRDFAMAVDKDALFLKIVEKDSWVKFLDSASKHYDNSSKYHRSFFPEYGFMEWVFNKEDGCYRLPKLAALAVKEGII